MNYKFNLLDRVVHKSVSDYPIYLIVARGIIEETGINPYPLYFCKNCDGVMVRFAECELEKVEEQPRN